MIVVNSPNNPGASVLSADDLERVRRAHARDRHCGRQRRGLRAHGVRRRAARELARNAELADAQHRHRLVRQDVPRHGLESGICAGAARDQRRNPPRASIHGIHRQQRGAACAGGVSRASRHDTKRCRLSSPPSGTLRDRRSPGRRSSSCLAEAAISSSPATVGQRRARARVCAAAGTEIGVATIPLSAFYQDGTDHRVIRFCFAKREETLLAAAERLRRLR